MKQFAVYDAKEFGASWIEAIQQETHYPRAQFLSDNILSPFLTLLLEATVFKTSVLSNYLG